METVKHAVDEILIGTEAAFELALEYVVREVGNFCGLGKFDYAFLDLLQHLVASVGKLLANQHPAQRATKMLCDGGGRLLAVGKRFHGHAFFVWRHVHAGNVFGKRDFVEAFGVLVDNVARDFLEPKLLCCREPAEPGDDAVVRGHAEIVGDGYRVDDSVCLDGFHEFIDILDFTDVVTHVNDVVDVDCSEAVRAFFWFCF